MRIDGQLLAVQHNSGQFTDKESGERVNWENSTLRIFDGHEVVVVKVKGQEAGSVALGLEASKGQHVSIDIDSPRQVETRTLAVAAPRKS